MKHRHATVMLSGLLAGLAPAQEISCLLPQPVSEVPVNYYTTPSKIVVRDGLLVMVDIYSIWVYDISNPVRPAVLSTTFAPESTDSSDGVTNMWYDPPLLVFQTTDYIDFTIPVTLRYYAYDLSDPSTPVSLGPITEASWSDQSFLDEWTLFVPRGSRFDLWDLSDPGDPVLTGVPGLYSGIGGAALVGDRLYFSDRTAVESSSSSASVHVIDVSDRASPRVEAAVPAPTLYTSLIPYADVLFAKHGALGLSVLGLADPLNPTLLATLDGFDADSFAVDGSTAIVRDSRGVTRVYDITEPTDPVPVVESSIEDRLLAFSGGYGYAVSGKHLRVYNLANLPVQAPGLISGFDTPGSLREVAIEGQTAYLADGPDGLAIADVSDPRIPSPLSTYPTTGWVYGVHVRDQVAYVSAGPQGMLILDVSDPSAPTRLGSLDTPGNAVDVAVAGNVAFVADGPNSPALVVDISDPAAPAVLAELRRPPYGDSIVAKDFFVSGDLLAVGGSWSGLYLYDIRDPAEPAFLWRSASSLSNGVDAVLIDGQRLYSGNNPNSSDVGKLVVWDTQDPTTPVVTDSYGLLARIRELDVRNGMAFVAADDRGLEILDVNDPADIRRLGTLPLEGRQASVTLSADHAFVGSDDAGMTVLDLSQNCGLCRADRNGDGVADVADIQLFLSDFLSGHPFADLNGDGIVDLGDIEAFVAAFLGGC